MFILPLKTFMMYHKPLSKEKEICRNLWEPPWGGSLSDSMFLRFSCLLWYFPMSRKMVKDFEMGETCLLSSLSYFKTLWRYRMQIVIHIKFLVGCNWLFPYIYMDLLCIFLLALFYFILAHGWFTMLF